MGDFHLPTPVFFESVAYRNIHTCSPTQDLLDDLLSDPEDYAIGFLLISRTAMLEELKQNYLRPFDYGVVPLHLQGLVPNWVEGRFADGNKYAVWYGSLEEQTSLTETYFRKMAESKIKIPLMKEDSFVSHRRMYQVQVTCKQISDLRPHTATYPQLISEDYAFCQLLGHQGFSAGLDGFIYTSARAADGSNLAVFRPESVMPEQKMLYVVRFEFFRDGRLPRVTRETKTDISDLFL
jgi:hypothetical protein